MSNIIRRLRAARDDERGFTMIEVVIASGLLIGALALFNNIITSTQGIVEKEVTRTQANDELQVALTQIDRQVRSGNLFYDPASENNAANGIVPGMSLRVYTQANGAYRCVQWRILDGKLETRAWTTDWAVSDNVTEFKTVADHVVNDRAGTAQDIKAFVLDLSPQYGKRLLKVKLVTNARPNTDPDAVVQLSVTGRNTGYGFPPTSCDPPPPYE